MNFKTLLIAVVFGVILSLALAFITTTGFGIEYAGTWVLILVGLLIVLVKSGLDNYQVLDKPLLTVTGFLASSLLIASLLSSSVFRADDYVASVEVKEANLTAMQTEEKFVRKVTLDMANAMATNLIGQKVDGVQISSQYQLNLDTASVQQVKGELVWVLPLDYSGFAKWIKQDYIPGYVVVSATNPKAEAKLILGQKIKVSQRGWFSDDISRVAWFRSGLKATNEHFEIDDNGKGYWICSVIKPSIGFSLDTVSSVLVVNAETKESTEMSIQDTMKKYPWIDRVWTEAIIEERIEAYGSLQDGWLNTMFGETNVNKPTSYENQELWLIKGNGKLQWFTGMSSINSDKSLVSAILVEANGGTNKPVLREIALTNVSDENGAIDAINSGLGADGNRWHAVLPQPVVSKGVFYWHASIISSSNLFEKAGLVQGDNRQNVFYGETISEAFGKTVKETTSAVVSSKDAIIAEILVKIDELNALKQQLKTAK